MSTVVKDLGAATAYGYAVEKGYTGTEAEFAELMADYAEVGQRAEDAADSALESKTAAQTAATTATTKASEATTAAQTATTKAGEASTSASTATSAKDTAVSASQTATTKATEATTAAATAVSAKDDAVSANTAAQSAKTAAQTAQTGAETAAASVSASAEQIATNAEDISQLKSDLSAEETARINADNALSTSVSNLETHKVAQPLDEYNQPTDGTDGQSLRTKGDGTTEWADVGLPTDAQTAQAVSNWLDEHPEVTTTIQDGSLTESKFSNALKLKTIKDYVTPEMFGAVGDGVTDDTDAVQSAIDNGDFILMCNDYLISSTITIDSKKVVNCTGTITFNGNAVAVKISTQNGGDYFFNEINALNGTCVLMEANTNGVYLNNTHKFNRLNGKIGCEIFAAGTDIGNQWNTLHLGWIKCTEKCIWIHSANGAFCGEWRIFGGLLHYNQPASGISVIGMDVSDCSALRVFGTGFEGLGIGLVIEDSNEINIYGSRFESANQYNGKSYVFKGSVGPVLISGDIYKTNDIDITALSTVPTNGSIVFDGLILDEGNTPIGNKYIISDDTLGIVSDRTKALSTELNFDAYYPYNVVGDIGGIAPKIIKANKRNLVLGDQYCAKGIDSLIILFTGSGYTISDTDGTVMVTTTDAYSAWEVKAIGSGFLGQGKGKNFLRFTKFASA